MIPCYHITHISHLAITFSEIFELEDVISPHPFLKVTQKKLGKLRSPRIVGWFNPAVLWFNVAPKKIDGGKVAYGESFDHESWDFDLGKALNDTWIHERKSHAKMGSWGVGMGVGSVNGEWLVSGWWCHLNADTPEDEALGGKREWTFLFFFGRKPILFLDELLTGI